MIYNDGDGQLHGIALLNKVRSVSLIYLLTAHPHPDLCSQPPVHPFLKGIPTMASEAAQKSQAILDKLVKDKKIPGAIACIVDRDGNTLFHGSAGVRELGKPEKM